MIKLTFVACVLLTAIIPSGNTVNAREKYSGADDFVYFKSGLLIPYKSKFRQYHGERYKLSVTYMKYMESNFILGLDLGYLIPTEGVEDLKYSNIYGAIKFYYWPVIKDNDYFIFANFGLGFNFRKISHEYIYENYIGRDIKRVTSFNDFGPSVVVGLGYIQFLSHNIFFGLELEYDYIYDPHPSRGDFGNTGGIHISLIPGFAF
jgi:hypothetical protein